MMILYGLLLSFFVWYSYALIDPNITFFNHPLWSRFLEQMLQLGYYHRDISWILYLFFIAVLFIFHFYFKRHVNRYQPLRLAIVIALILVISYPFLSHDLFNYLFDAKIVTVYHQNPYLHKALDFPHDPWLRFLQWTHRSYPYGPVFLAISIVPSFLSFGKFLLGFIFYKATVMIFYLISVYVLQKVNKRWAIIFATHPLILVEGLVNGHNDLIALSLGIIGIYYFIKNNSMKGRLFALLSGGIKYITLPLLGLTKNNTRRNAIFIGLQLIILAYLSFNAEIQPWYFLVLFALLPYCEKVIERVNVFFFGLLMSYYPYIYLGGWDKPEKVNLKHQIIIIFLILNGLWFILRKKIHNNKM